MYFGSVRITVIFMNFVGTIISDTYKLPYNKGVWSHYTFPYALFSFNSWVDTTNIICGLKQMSFTSDFYQYSTSFSGSTVSFLLTITGGSSLLHCLNAGSKICQITRPYYDMSTDLCHDSCPGQNTVNYLCTPVYTCPSNCDHCSSNTVCTTCSSGYYLRADYLCYSSCSAGSQPSSGSNICCPTGCANCTSLTICQACSPPF